MKLLWRNFTLKFMSIVLFSSATIDLTKDGISDFGDMGVESIQYEQVNDNDEVLQALGKGSLAILSLLLTKITTVHFTKKNVGHITMHFVSKFNVSSLNGLFENEIHQDDQKSEIWNLHRNKFIKLIEYRLTNRADNLVISHLEFEVSKDTLNAYLECRYAGSNTDSNFKILCEKIAKVLESLVSEKIANVEKHARDFNQSFEVSMTAVVNKQIEDARSLLNDV